MAHAQPIKLGNLVDLTGPTSDQGKDIAQGRNDAVQYFNEKGGINGRKIELVSVEYGFQPPRAVAAYKKFVEDDKVLLVLGYGTPDTEALRPYITKDKMPYISGSYSGHLTDPRQTPYNFPGGIDYTSQIRIFLNYVKENWKDTSRKPRVAFIYADNAYGRAPIEAGRQYAKEIGIDLVDEEIIPTVLTDATSQLLTMQKKDPDFVYINTNTQWVPVVLKDALKLGLKTKFVVNNYGIDERTPKLAGEAAEGVMGFQDVAYFGENVPGMKTMMEFHQKHHPDDTHALALHARVALGDPGRRGDQEGRPEPDGRVRQERAGEPEGLRHVGPDAALHLHDRGPSADQPRAARHGQGRQARADARGLRRPRHEVDRQVRVLALSSPIRGNAG